MKASVVDNSLIQLVFLEWKHVKAGAQFTSITGDRIAIIDKGDTFDEQRLLCLNAKVEINDCEKQGHIAFGNRELNANQGVVLHVMDKEGLGILSDDFRLIPQIVVPVDPELEDLLKSLIKGSKSCDCVKKILEIDPFVVSHFMNSLLYERLENKYNEVMQKHEMGGCNWHQTLHLMLFRAMGSPANTQAFVEIAKRVPYNVASHESGSHEMLEALLYGASGLLQTRSDRFGYIKTLRLHFSHLSNKYDIMPLKAGAWLLHSGAFKGRPVTRLMQTAALLKDDNFLFDNVIEVRELSQIYKIFSAETSAFWRDDPDIPQRIGKDRQEVLAINMLVPLLFAYYKSIKQEDDMEAAIDLLYKIPAEKNILANPWRKKGMKVENSADTQALIQLKKFYCNFKKCADCRFGKEIIRMKIKEKSK